MRNLLLIILLFCFSIAYSQMKITGKILNQDNEPVSFAEVLLLNKDSIAIKSELSDENGFFSLDTEQGSYILQVRQSEAIIYTKNIEISDNLDLGTIVTENTTNLQEVVIQGNKKLIEKKVDRLIFNIENAISATGGDALDALKITPKIKVQNDQISMVGKSEMAVMIDNILVQVSGEDLTNLLKNIPSDNIKSIEIITNPPAKYDAKGNSGIININLKKAMPDSWSNIIRNSYKQARYPSFLLGNNFTYQKNKLSLLFDITATKGTGIYTNDMTYDYPTEFWKSEAYNKTKSDGISTILNLGYKLSDNLTAGVQYSDNFNSPKVDERGKSYVYENDKFLSKILQSVGKTGKNTNNHSIDLNLLNKIDTLGKIFSVNLDYFVQNSARNNVFNAENINNILMSSTTECAKNNSKQNIENFSAKIDFDIPHKWINLSFGGKISFIENNSDIDFNSYDTTNGNNILDSSQANIFNYKENTQALYFSANKKIKEKWEVKAGLRVETTQTKGYSENMNQTNKNDYVRFFPTFYLSFQANEDNNYSLSYGKRVDRPYYSWLNPARWYQNSNSYAEGNPFLQPSFVSNVDLSHSYKNLLISTLSFSALENGFGQLAIHDIQNKIQSSIWRNYYDYYFIGLSEYVNYNIGNWWTTTLDLSVYYTETNAYSEYLSPKYSGWGGYTTTTNSFNINKNKTILAQLIYEYNYPTLSAESKTDSWSKLSIGLKFLFFEDNLQFSINANNILGSDRATLSDITQGISQSFRQYYDSQFIRFSLSYKLGNKNLKINKKETGNEDEKNRAS